MMRFTVVAISLLLSHTASAAFVARPRHAVVRLSSPMMSVASNSITPENATAFTSPSTTTSTDNDDKDLVLDESRFLKDMQREIDAVDRLNSYQPTSEESSSSSSLLLMKPEAASAAAVASHIQSPYPKHEAAIQELALKAEEMVRKYDAPIQVGASPPKQRNDATPAFLVLGISIAALTMADPNMVLNQLSNLMDLDLDLSALHIDVTALDKLLDLSSSVHIDLSSLSSAMIGARDSFLTQLAGLQEHTIVQAHNAQDIIRTQLLALKELAKVDMRQFLLWLREVHDELVAKFSSSATVQQFAHNHQMLVQDMNRGAQILLDSKTWTFQMDGQALVARMQETQNALFATASLSSFQLPTLPNSLATMSDNVAKTIMGKQAFNVDGIHQGMDDILARTTTSLNQAKLGLQDAVQMSGANLQQLTRNAVDLVGHVQATMLTQSSNIQHNVADLQNAVLDKTASMEMPTIEMPDMDLSHVKTISLGLPDMSSVKTKLDGIPAAVNVDGMKQGVLESVQQVQSSIVAKTASIEVPQFDIDTMKHDVAQAIPQVDVIAMSQDVVGRVQDTQAALLAKTAGMEMPPLDMESVKQGFLGGLQDLQNHEVTKTFGNNFVAMKDDFINMMQSVKDIKIVMPQIEQPSFDMPKFDSPAVVDAMNGWKGSLTSKVSSTMSLHESLPLEL